MLVAREGCCLLEYRIRICIHEACATELRVRMPSIRFHEYQLPCMQKQKRASFAHTREFVPELCRKRKYWIRNTRMCMPHFSLAIFLSFPNNSSMTLCHNEIRNTYFRHVNVCIVFGYCRKCSGESHKDMSP